MRTRNAQKHTKNLKVYVYMQKCDKQIAPKNKSNHNSWFHKLVCKPQTTEIDEFLKTKFIGHVQDLGHHQFAHFAVSG